VLDIQGNPVLWGTMGELFGVKGTILEAGTSPRSSNNGKTAV